jgi:hypothetical protein
MLSPIDSGNSSHNRLCISSLVHMTTEQDKDFFDLIEDADVCLADMCKRAMSDSTMRKYVEMVISKEDSAGLKRLIASMQKRILNHDAAAAPPAALAYAPSAQAPPCSLPANSAPSVSASETEGRKRRRRGAPPPDSDPESSSEPVAQSRNNNTRSWHPAFRSFAFNFGRDYLAKHSSLTRLTNDVIYKAFLYVQEQTPHTRVPNRTCSRNASECTIKKSQALTQIR